jgi:ribosomal protein S18 acetylase RimI-like enzyme
VADLPDPVGGVSFRLFAGDTDFKGMVAVLNAASAHDGVDRHETVEDLTHSYRHLTNCDLETDLLIVERESEIVAYRRVFWYVEEATKARVMAHIGWVHPEGRSSGAGAAAMRWAEQRAVESAGANPHDGSTHLQSWADERERETVADLEAAGYRVAETYAEMTRSLRDPITDHPLPAALEIRPVGEKDRRRVWEADQEAFRDHVGFSPGTEEDYQEFAGRRIMDPALWKVAFDGDEIAGQVLNYVDDEENSALDRKRGWTEWITTQRAWRGKGLAKALITESMLMFREMGMEEVALGVHTTNPTGAFGLYEGLGYEIVSKGFEFRKDLP